MGVGGHRGSSGDVRGELGVLGPGQGSRGEFPVRPSREGGALLSRAQDAILGSLAPGKAIRPNAHCPQREIPFPSPATWAEDAAQLLRDLRRCHIAVRACIL